MRARQRIHWICRLDLEQHAHKGPRRGLYPTKLTPPRRQEQVTGARWPSGTEQDIEQRHGAAIADAAGTSRRGAAPRNSDSQRRTEQQHYDTPLRGYNKRPATRGPTRIYDITTTQDGTRSAVRIYIYSHAHTHADNIPPPNARGRPIRSMPAAPQDGDEVGGARRDACHTLTHYQAAPPDIHFSFHALCELGGLVRESYNIV